MLLCCIESSEPSESLTEVICIASAVGRTAHLVFGGVGGVAVGTVALACSATTTRQVRPILEFEDVMMCKAAKPGVCKLTAKAAAEGCKVHMLVGWVLCQLVRLSFMTCHW